MKRDKIYISGPISSRPLGVAINHFLLAEAILQTQGYRTCNPLKMKLCVWLATHDHKRICLFLQLLWLWLTCDCIYLLDGWHKSDGARLERAAARCLDLTALYEQKRKSSPIGKAGRAIAELGKAISACAINADDFANGKRMRKKNHEKE